MAAAFRWRGCSAASSLPVQYGDAAELWRVNLGWSRRENKDDRGFWLDVENSGAGPNAPLTRTTRRKTAAKRPPAFESHSYVKDRRNSLVVALADEWDLNVMASLEASLKRAIQIDIKPRRC